MHKNFTYLLGVLAGWSLYYISFPVFNFLKDFDPFEFVLFEAIFGILDFAFKTLAIGAVIFFSFFLLNAAWEVYKNNKQQNDS
ncbi:hypothetical protein [Thalassobacillus pellis]|uniref:hypothetical protein n=1 Tax=Thalassobacillus pellis TaxID=748008 RepID=UPI00195F4922|nr:hypothetical protein [Thalassobacillus pellis]MBM7553521.1 hypothetical protein [Thalassobacillus pellis]